MAPMHAQVFIMEDGESYRDPTDPGFVVLPNDYGDPNDVFTPVGNGAIWLAALGGAYLLSKKSKKTK